MSRVVILGCMFVLVMMLMCLGLENDVVVNNSMLIIFVVLLCIKVLKVCVIVVMMVCVRCELGCL